MGEHKLDDIDKNILSNLQENSDLSVEELSKKVNISKTPCWNRIKRLKKQGYIQKTISLLDEKKLGLNTRVIVMIEVSGHNVEWLDYFSEKIANMREVVRFYRLTGNYDFSIEVILANITEYDIFYKKLLEIKNITKVSSMVVLEEIKKHPILKL